MKQDYRIGFGFDVHRFSRDRLLVLGGVVIPYEFGLDGHSDADVLLHAICDAMLGALALGDIGKHFPNTSQEFKNIDSKILLAKSNDLINGKGYIVNNIDSTLVLELPRLSPYISLMQNEIASVLKIEPDRISVKATTSERLGFTGRKEGIAAFATVLLTRKES
ncbi:2C-methyl-D-erythritol 2,4-cyclodiphosphate synthase [Melioribacter roseus P3M-2]|uniref:2-C-methyl-D-erythritol 2,4-cyclodiphosphate synthase n=1 Tax=Melioribacter roseus (strain DSM 23840 / JCM 17771 / VKM B-2668 / P3M-2) TaxID=1191523 RepID=I6YWQ5_MELRP|nr:2-C-methyl-D-erythritol 2,4-cyclodiphosphate synthase [Melioribacter roseus]AFN74997.1 2C-methyl-D-erythritol 2,4-cyclodiphosphate synthase [Melioribacter roseus P3M-2]